jgi:hypothetical protein
MTEECRNLDEVLASVPIAGSCPCLCYKVTMGTGTNLSHSTPSFYTLALISLKRLLHVFR